MSRNGLKAGEEFKNTKSLKRNTVREFVITIHTKVRLNEHEAEIIQSRLNSILGTYNDRNECEEIKDCFDITGKEVPVKIRVDERIR